METEKISPGVWIDGQLYTPKSWEWILSFALAGCEWAIKEASKPGFRETILADLKERKKEKLQSTIDIQLRRIDELKEEMRILDE